MLVSIGSAALSARDSAPRLELCAARPSPGSGRENFASSHILTVRRGAAFVKICTRNVGPQTRSPRPDRQTAAPTAPRAARKRGDT